MRQYDLTVMANIGDILVKEMTLGIDGLPLELVCTPADLDILAVKFVQVLHVCILSGLGLSTILLIRFY